MTYEKRKSFAGAINKQIAAGGTWTKQCTSNQMFLVVLNPFRYAAEVTQFYASDLQDKSRVSKWLQTYYPLHRNFLGFQVNTKYNRLFLATHLV